MLERTRRRLYPKHLLSLVMAPVRVEAYKYCTILCQRGTTYDTTNEHRRREALGLQ